MGIKMTKISFALMLLFISALLYASELTTNYNLEIPSSGQRDWLSLISKDIISIDTVMGIISADLGATSTKILISRDTNTTVGGAVGRCKVVSADGTSCYILLYAGS